MTSMLRVLLATVLVAWIAQPTIGGGGENAGGSGVWILPRPGALACSSGTPQGAPRAQFTVVGLASDLRLQISSEMGLAVASLVEDLTGTPMPLQVSGLVVEIPTEMLLAIGAQSPSEASVLISDANQLGYVLELEVDAPTDQVVVKVW
jgi:hypothetical protein